jgi:lysophospholipase L1-like esterase
MIGALAGLRTIAATLAMSIALVQTTDPPWQSSPRTDRNSAIAHEQMVEKSKQGVIDAYFIGDSITRRWGALDYPELLDNWKTNFFGWNAANFGWGADRTENMLWRLENGEFDDPHPRIVVVLAGTNNVAAARSGDDNRVGDITRGVEAIVDFVRRRVPAATIVLTAIFPRNDRPELLPDILRINTNLARIADGRLIRFVNINDRLADSDGRLFAGMMNDGLHPTVRAYQIWADALKPIFTEVLGPPASVDRAPAPTGDPSRAVP